MLLVLLLFYCTFYLVEKRLIYISIEQQAHCQLNRHCDGRHLAVFDMKIYLQLFDIGIFSRDEQPFGNFIIFGSGQKIMLLETLCVCFNVLVLFSYE